MTKKVKRILVCVGILLLAGAWIWRYTTLNAFYQSLDNSSISYYEMHEIVPLGKNALSDEVMLDGYAIRVDSFEIVDFETYAASVGLDKVPYAPPERLGVATITLYNETGEGPGVMLAELLLHSVDTLCFPNWDLLVAANPILDGAMGICLPKGGACTLEIPFGILKLDFTGYTWRHMDSYDFWMEVTSFPEQKNIRVQ